MKNKIINLDKINTEVAALSAEIKTLPEGNLNKRGKYYCHAINRKDIGITNNLS